MAAGEAMAVARWAVDTTVVAARWAADTTAATEVVTMAATAVITTAVTDIADFTLGLALASV
jgi:hypothetical protein